MTRTAVIVPTWNNTDLTIKCLRALAEHTVEYVLIWIDNGSDKRSREAVMAEIERLGIFHKQWLFDENQGFPKAINRGLRMAMAGDYGPIVFLNNDVEVTAGWLGKLKAALKKNPRLGIVGTLHDTGVQDFRKFHSRGDVSEINAMPMSVRTSNGCVPFSCVAVRRSVVEKIGLLDEDFSPCLGEDNDYCDRARIAGYAMGWATNCVTYHKHRSTVSKLPGWEDIQAKNTALLARKRAARKTGTRKASAPTARRFHMQIEDVERKVVPVHGRRRMR